MEEPPVDQEVSLSDTEAPADDGGGGDLEAAMGLGDEGDEAEAEAEAAPEPEAEVAEVEAEAAPEPEPEVVAAAPVPAAAPAAEAAAPAAAAPAKAKAPAKAASRFTFTMKVCDPERIGDGIGSYIVYKVLAKTNMPEYKTPEMDVSRRFTDFFNLQKQLQTTNPGVIVPPCPPKDAVQKGKSLFKSDEGANDAFTEKRAKALQRFLKRVVAHPELINDPLLHQFLETDDKMPAPKKDLLSFIKIPPVEVDEWFDDKTRELSVLDNQLKKLHAASVLLCEGRKDLSHHTDRFSKSFAALAQVEELKQLTTAMHRLADVEAKVHRLHSNQARRDMFDFSEIIFDYISLVGS